MRIAFAAGLLALLLFAPTTTADWGWGDNRVKETESFEQTYDAANDAAIRIETTNGNIEIETWDRDEVQVRAEKKARARDRDDAQALLDETEIVVRETSAGLTIEADLPEGSWRKRRGNVSVNFQLMVPRGASVESHSTNGGIDIAGTGGRVEAVTTNGGITLRDIGGDADLETTNGQIKAFGIGGALNARTTNGGIDAEVLATSLNDDMRLTTTNGSVDIALSTALVASVDASAQNGRVYNDIEDVYSHGSSRKSAAFDMNGGGPTIRMRTTNGRIRITEVN